MLFYMVPFSCSHVHHYNLKQKKKWWKLYCTFYDSSLTISPGGLLLQLWYHCLKLKPQLIAYSSNLFSIQVICTCMYVILTPIISIFCRDCLSLVKVFGSKNLDMCEKENRRFAWYLFLITVICKRKNSFPWKCTFRAWNCA